jgi:hypothetical protein
VKEAEEGIEPSPLSTIEEQEDRRILERAREQMRKESVGKEKDVGRTTSLSPTGARSEQVIPSVTVQPSDQGPSDDSIAPIEYRRMEVVESPIEEKSFILEESSYVSEKVV